MSEKRKPGAVSRRANGMIRRPRPPAHLSPDRHAVCPGSSRDVSPVDLRLEFVTQTRHLTGVCVRKADRTHPGDTEASRTLMAFPTREIGQDGQEKQEGQEADTLYAEAEFILFTSGPSCRIDRAMRQTFDLEPLYFSASQL